MLGPGNGGCLSRDEQILEIREGMDWNTCIEASLNSIGDEVGGVLANDRLGLLSGLAMLRLKDGCYGPRGLAALLQEPSSKTSSDRRRIQITTSHTYPVLLGMIW